MAVVPFRNSDPESLPLETEFWIPDWFRFTWCRWNHTTRRGGKDRDGQVNITYIKKFALEGEVSSYEYGTYCEFPREIESQPGLICSPQSRFMVVECDDPADFDTSILGEAVPTVRSSRGFHYYFAVSPDLTDFLPTDGPIPGGDVQTNGFVPAPGCTHPAGATYTLVSNRINVADAELITRLRAARTRQGEKLRAAYRERGGTGTWEGQGGINGQDDYLAKEVCWPLVRSGKSEAEVRAEWDREAAALPLTRPDFPFGDDDFERHYRGAMRKYQAMQEADTAHDALISGWNPLLNAAEQESEEQVDDEQPGFLPRGYIVPAGFRIEMDMTWEEVLTKDGTDLRKAAYYPVYVSRRMYDDRGNVQYEVTWQEYDGVRAVCAPVSALRNSSKVADVFPEAVVSTSESHALSRYLVRSIKENAEWLREHQVRIATRLGWQEGTDIFVAGDERPCQVRDIANLGRWVTGHVQAGSLEAWRAALARAPWRVLVLTAGALAAPLLRLLGVPGFVVDNAGETTRGKTRAARAAASVWGDPDKTVLSWSATRVALERYAVSAHGVAIIVDDSKLARTGNQIAEIIYQIASGTSTSRSDRSGTRLQEMLEIETVMVTNGEQPLLAASERSDGGAAARVVELWGPPFETAGQADALDIVVSEHYGHAGEAFVSYLLGCDHEGLLARYRVLREKTQAVAQSDVARRRGSAIAVLRLAAELAHEAGLLPAVSESAWTHIVLEEPGDEGADDLPQAALDMLWNEVVTNRKIFWESYDGSGIMSAVAAGTGNQPPNGYAGRLETKDAWLAVKPKWLEKFLHDAGYDYAGIIRIWAERGWVARDSAGKSQVQVKLAGKNGRFIKIIHGGDGAGFGEDLMSDVNSL